LQNFTWLIAAPAESRVVLDFKLRVVPVNTAKGAGLCNVIQSENGASNFEPLPATTFHASVKPILPELRIVRTLSPGLGFRDEDLLKDGDNSFGFIIAQSQELTVRQDARFSLGVATRR
jgi:hypothetical protein